MSAIMQVSSHLDLKSFVFPQLADLTRNNHVIIISRAYKLDNFLKFAGYVYESARPEPNCETDAHMHCHCLVSDSKTDAQ